MNEAEFMKAYDDFSDALFRHCYFRLSDREEAKDAVQETFMRAWQYRESHEIKNIKAFLYKTAQNLIVDKYRKKKNYSLDELKESGFEPKDDSHIKMAISAEAKNFIKMLHQLDNLEREVIIMRYIDGLGPEEIAETIGGDASPNVISVRLSRAMNKMRGFMEN